MVLLGLPRSLIKLSTMFSRQWDFFGDKKNMLHILLWRGQYMRESSYIFNPLDFEQYRFPQSNSAIHTGRISWFSSVLSRCGRGQCFIIVINLGFFRVLKTWPLKIKNHAWVWSRAGRVIHNVTETCHGSFAIPSLCWCQIVILRFALVGNDSFIRLKTRKTTINGCV